MIKRCGNCGSKEIEQVNLKGRATEWGAFPAVRITKDLFVRECRICKNQILTSGDVSRVHEACLDSVKFFSVLFINTILEREKCQQKDLAMHLGVTPEHLSQVKGGTKIPSYSLYVGLRMQAFEPKSFTISDPNFDEIVMAKEMGLSA